MNPDDLRLNFETYLGLAGLDPDLVKRFMTLYFHAALVDPAHQRTGIDLFRYFEYSLTWQFGGFSSQDTVLDVGSFDSLWPTFLLAFGCRVMATDLEMERLQPQRLFMSRLDPKVYSGNLSFGLRNATQLTDADNSFTRVTAISAIEHIPQDGDLLAASEARRVLQPGGLAVITAPYSQTFVETNPDYYGGYEKRYDQARLARLIAASGLKPVQIAFLQERFPGTQGITGLWYDQQLYRHLGHVSPFLSLALFDVTSQPTDLSLGFVAALTKTE